ncbi:hypothetical protein P7C71_g2330, partial [Lecanoromycetidae sp. Uapishka_2]
MSLDEWIRCVKHHTRGVDDVTGNSLIQTHDFAEPNHFGPQAPTLPQLQSDLRPYQQQAVHWLVTVKRGILADDMGLGKTLTMLATTCTLPRAVNEVQTTLVILPKALLKSWSNEISKRTKPGVIKSRIIHGTKEAKSVTHGEMIKNHIILTTRATVYDQIKHLETFRTSQQRGSVKNMPTNGWPILGVLPCEKERNPEWTAYKCVVIDEAHFMRNPESHMAQNLHKIQAEYRYCMSGTPIQNTHEDFFPLLHFIHHPAGSDIKTFRSNYKGRQSAKFMSEVLATITRLIQCSCDPRLLRAREIPEAGHKDKKQKVENAELMEKVQKLLADAQPISTKVRLLIKILDARLAQKPDLKFIIFAEYTDFLKIIKTHLEAIGLTIDTWIMRRQQQKLQWAAQAAGRAFTGQEEIKGGAMGARDVAEMLGESGTGLAEYDLTRMIDASDREDDTSMADEDEMDTDED